MPEPKFIRFADMFKNAKPSGLSRELKRWQELRTFIPGVSN